jgi:hypothetical protein
MQGRKTNTKYADAQDETLHAWQRVKDLVTHLPRLRNQRKSCLEGERSKYYPQARHKTSRCIAGREIKEETVLELPKLEFSVV